MFRLDSSEEYDRSVRFCLIVGKSWRTAEGSAFVFLWWKSRYKTMIFYFGATYPVENEIIIFRLLSLYIAKLI